MIADALRDLLDIAGDVAALDRQRTAIPRHRPSAFSVTSSIPSVAIKQIPIFEFGHDLAPIR